MPYKRKLPAIRGQLSVTAKPPKPLTNIFIREEDIPRLLIVTRAGETVEIELLCGDTNKPKGENRNETNTDCDN